MAAGANVRPDDRQRRLLQLSSEWGISHPQSRAPLRSPAGAPPSPPSYRTPNDDYQAEELLKRQRLLASQNQQHQGSGLKRAFTNNKKAKGWEPKEVFDALDAHVANVGSPGVAEALISKLAAAGGDLNVATSRSKTSLLTRRRSLESLERSKVLQKAIENGQVDMVSVLVPHADPLTLDSSLPVAIRSGNTAVTELLLRNGANASQTAEGQDAFRQACATGGQADLVGLILQSDGRPPPSRVSQAMVDATRAGCLTTVTRLGRSTADGNYNNAAALKDAIAQCRVDIALAIVTGNKPPVRPALDEACAQLFAHSTILPNEKLLLTELLLCAGAEGDAVSEALIHACETEFYEMVHLLTQYCASLDFQQAAALRHAVSRGKTSLVDLLLNGRSTLSAQHASDCVALIPKRINFEERFVMLNHFLRRGANGAPLHKCLVDCVGANDVECVKLLLTPYFQDGSQQYAQTSQRGVAFGRHAVASVEYKDGLALQMAVTAVSVPLVELIVASKPSFEILARVFPSISKLQPAEKYQVTELFLATGLKGACVHDALQRAIDEPPPHRNDRFVALLLRHDADPNSNDGAGILAALAQGDLTLLETLLNKKPTVQTAALAIPKAMEISDVAVRRRALQLLLTAGANVAHAEVAAALITTAKSSAADMETLELLLSQGQADVNYDSGAPLAHAARNPNPEVLSVVLRKGRPTGHTLKRGLQAVGESHPTSAKAAKLEVILRLTKPKDTIDSLLVGEVQRTLKAALSQRALSVLKILLDAGADVNAYNAAAICHAVGAANSQVTDMLFAAQPTPSSLQHALPHALKIKDPMDRLAFTKKLLDAGAPAAEANRALVFAVGSYPDDVPLINTLSTKADSGDGEALEAAVKKQLVDVVSLLLSKREYGANILHGSLTQAMKGNDRGKRQVICEALLESGASGEVISESLQSAASDGDLALGAMLLQRGASVEHREGQSVVEACRAGAADVLEMLLSGKTSVQKKTLERGFQAATEVADLNKRENVFRLLLENGVAREAVDAQLVSAVKYGRDGKGLVKLLLEYGANTDYNGGEAISAATRSAFLVSLKMLLGIAKVGQNQHKPSQATLLRALKASLKLSPGPRLQIIQWLFDVGLPITEDMHVTLAKVVEEEEPDQNLVQLLLNKGASPVMNGCKAFVTATRNLATTIVTTFLQLHISQSDLDLIFAQSFDADNVDKWLSEEGFEVAKALLEKGARGDGLSSALILAIDARYGDASDVSLRFIELLLRFDADVDHEDGLALQKATQRADADLIASLLEHHPNTVTISSAFSHVFDLDLSEQSAHQLIGLFAEYSSGENGLDVMFNYAPRAPIVFRALNRYPRSTKVLGALLDAGYYHDQMTTTRVMENVDEEEQVSLLFWALLQPQKRVSSTIITMLINKGAKVNFETRLSKSTPIMLAIQQWRADIVKALLLAGADVDVADVTGNTPMTMASNIGGELGITMMSNILAAEPSKNDGSLHNAARELNLPALQVLSDYGHHVDFPSPLHGGRSALGELCLHAADGGTITGTREKMMEKTMEFLLEKGTDLSLLSGGKSVLLLALESADPMPTTRALLKVGLWNYVNKSSMNYTDGTYTYSATMYVSRILQPGSSDPDVHSDLITLLKANRATDVFYANSGPQPDDAVGLPPHILAQEIERKARLERIATEDEDHARAISRTQELAAIQNQIWRARAELEDARAARQRADEMGAIRERGRAEEDVFNQAIRRQRAERAAAMQHAQALTQAELDRGKAVADAQLELEGRKQARMLEWQRQAGRERVENQKQLSAAKVGERKDLEVLEVASDLRFRERVAAQQGLVESQNLLASNLNNAGVNGRRQVGYITGELN